MNKAEYDIAVKLYSGRIMGYFVKSLRDREVAKDLVQDTFMRLWMHKEKVDPEKAKAWLFVSAHNALLNHVNRKRTTSLENEVVEDRGTIPQHRFELSEVIDKAMEYLPPLQKSILLLRDLEGYAYKEIGEMLELSESQVKVYLFRARKKMKDVLINEFQYQ